MSTEESLAKAQSALATAEQQLEYEKKKVANLNAKENKRAELGVIIFLT